MAHLSPQGSSFQGMWFKMVFLRLFGAELKHSLFSGQLPHSWIRGCFFFFGWLHLPAEFRPPATRSSPGGPHPQMQLALAASPAPFFSPCGTGHDWTSASRPLHQIDLSPPPSVTDCGFWVRLTNSGPSVQGGPFWRQPEILHSRQ